MSLLRLVNGKVLASLIVIIVVMGVGLSLRHIYPDSQEGHGQQGSLTAPQGKAGPESARALSQALGGTGYYFSASGCPGTPAPAFPAGTTTMTLVIDWPNVPPANVPNRVEASVIGRRIADKIGGDAVNSFTEITRTIGSAYDCVDIPQDIPYSTAGNAYYEHLLYAGKTTEDVNLGGAITMTVLTNATFTIPVTTVPRATTRITSTIGPAQVAFHQTDPIYYVAAEPCLAHYTKVFVTGTGGFNWQSEGDCRQSSGFRRQIAVAGTMAVGSYTVTITDKWATHLYPPITFTVIP